MLCVYIYIYIHLYVYTNIHICTYTEISISLSLSIYIYIERERERDRYISPGDAAALAYEQRSSNCSKNPPSQTDLRRGHSYPPPREVLRVSFIPRMVVSTCYFASFEHGGKYPHCGEGLLGARGLISTSLDESGSLSRVFHLHETVENAFQT